MSELRQYIITVVIASVIVSAVCRLTVNMHTHKLIKMVSGLVLSIVLLSPFGKFRIISLESYFETVNSDAHEAVAYGQQISRDNLNAIIEEQCESYILDKANELEAEINVSVYCDMSEIPVPVYAELTGNVSPYIRNRLKTIIANDLGIPEEKQLWI